MELRDTPEPADGPSLSTTPPSPIQHGALLRACAAVLTPLARLAVGRGLRYTEMVEVLKQCFVAAAREAHPSVAPHRAVSRISAATGLNRREVARQMQRADDEAAVRPSPSTQAFTRWLTEPALQAPGGGPLPLPVLGRAPSFESLAHSITRDVHPRTLLEELTRLGLARVDDRDGRVHLLHTAFVPRADRDRMLAFLGANVGDHLAAAVDNVQADGNRQFEQALFADELSEASLEQVRALVSSEWRRLLNAMAPALQSFIDGDKAAGRTGDHRIRIGLYAYTDAMAPAAAPPVPKEN